MKLVSYLINDPNFYWKTRQLSKRRRFLVNDIYRGLCWGNIRLKHSDVLWGISPFSCDCGFIFVLSKRWALSKTSEASFTRWSGSRFICFSLLCALIVLFKKHLWGWCARLWWFFLGFVSFLSLSSSSLVSFSRVDKSHFMSVHSTSTAAVVICVDKKVTVSQIMSHGKWAQCGKNCSADSGGTDLSSQCILAGCCCPLHETAASLVTVACGWWHDWLWWAYRSPAWRAGLGPETWHQNGWAGNKTDPAWHWLLDLLWRPAWRRRAHFMRGNRAVTVKYMWWPAGRAVW